MEGKEWRMQGRKLLYGVAGAALGLLIVLLVLDSAVWARQRAMNRVIPESDRASQWSLVLEEERRWREGAYIESGPMSPDDWDKTVELANRFVNARGQKINYDMTLAALRKAGVTGSREYDETVDKLIMVDAELNSTYKEFWTHVASVRGKSTRKLLDPLPGEEKK